MLPVGLSPTTAWLLSRDLFEKTGVKPSQVGILVVNCSLFVPTPSWCAHIMNTFKMSSDTLSFNLGGMGCSGECGCRCRCRDGVVQGWRGRVCSDISAQALDALSNILGAGPHITAHVQILQTLAA